MLSVSALRGGSCLTRLPFFFTSFWFSTEAVKQRSVRRTFRTGEQEEVCDVCSQEHLYTDEPHFKRTWCLGGHQLQRLDLHHLPAQPTASESQLGPHWSTVGPEPGWVSASWTSLGSEVTPPSSFEAAASPGSSKRKVKKPLIQSEPSSAKMLRTSSSDSAFTLPPPSLDKPDGREREGGANGGNGRNGQKEKEEA